MQVVKCATDARLWYCPRRMRSWSLAHPILSSVIMGVVVAALFFLLTGASFDAFNVGLSVLLGLAWGTSWYLRARVRPS